MPTYEFRCPKGHEFEKFYRSIGTAPSEVHCPECGALAVRQMSGAGLVFKGSGFYITDYGKDGKKDQQKAPVKSDGGSSEKSDATSAKAGESGTGGGGATSGSKPSESKSSESKSGESKSGASPEAKSASTDSKSSGSGTESKQGPASSKKKDAK